ncbi:MAG: DUF885 family protein [Alphaproteobacteria bacterium]|nr:DUF885 family protein [Alphaproteobacteria bacterium]
MRAKTLIRTSIIALCAVAAIHAADARSRTHSFAALVQSYYDEQFRTHPISATRAGIHTYDRKVDDLSAAGYEADIRRLKAALRSFEDANPKSDRERDERDVLVANIKGELLDLETIQYWRKNPNIYAGTATASVFGLVHRDFAPPAVRMRAAIAREKLIPAMLAAGKANITHPPKAFVEIAMRNIKGSINFFRTGTVEAFRGVKNRKLQREFEAANNAVIAALEDYQTYLEKDLLPQADGTFALSADIFAQRLADKEMVDTPPAALLDIAYAQLHKDQAALKQAAHDYDANKSVEEVVTEIRAQHPTPETLISTARDQLAALRQFVEQHRIITIPSRLMPTVEETPGFRRATTAAAMDSPGPFERRSTEAFYYVSPPDAGLSPDKLEQYLQAYYFAGLEIISAHEVWPGHFVQYLTRRAHREWSLARKMTHAQSTTEGWAHYTEQMMVEQGLNGADPKTRIAQIEDALLRDCRFVSSLEMHTRGKSVEDAQNIFMKECGSPEPEAHREALRGTVDPGYLNYTIGKLEILKLRDDYKKKLGDRFSLTEFHDRFLAAGLVPVKIIRREMLGEDSPVL